MGAAPKFGASQLALTDARLALLLLNHLRHLALRKVFGTSRDQANVLTAVVLLGAADGVYEGVRWAGGYGSKLTRSDAGMGAFALRGAAFGVAGPGSRDIPGFGRLVAFAVLAGLAVPGMRRRAHGMYDAERRVRGARIDRYTAARERSPSGAQRTTRAS